ncbi:MAG: hypothetical protein IKM12_05930 [Alistipes sp.]|nr:hypothetical protein [Alistipes sp.]
MEDLFNWVEANISYFYKANIDRVGDAFPIDDFLSIREKGEDGRPMAEVAHYRKLLLSTLISADDGCRKFIFRHLFSIGWQYFQVCSAVFSPEYGVSHYDFVDAECDYATSKDIIRTFNVLKDDIYQFYYWVRVYCEEWGYNVDDLLKPCDSDGLLKLVYNYYEHREPLQREEKEKYVTLKPTHRRAVVKMLLTSTGVAKNIDKTKIAAFVEAVTGGNIEAEPKDSMSYKEPTKPAKEEAKKWLSSIGINVKE